MAYLQKTLSDGPLILLHEFDTKGACLDQTGGTAMPWAKPPRAHKQQLPISPHFISLRVNGDIRCGVTTLRHRLLHLQG